MKRSPKDADRYAMGGSEFAHLVHTDKAHVRLQPFKDVTCSDFSRPHPSSGQR